MAKLVLPRVQAMVLCDEVEGSNLEDATFHLMSVRFEIEASTFPTVHPQLCVFLHLSGHGGKASFHIEIDCVATDDVVYETEPQVIEFTAPGSVVPEFFRMHNCVFPSLGLYYVQIYADGRLIGERPLQLRKVE